MRLLKGVLVDVANEEAKVIEIEDTLENLYKVTNCDCIDIIRRKIGRKAFTIVCDDEGLLKDEIKISAIDNLGGAQLVGNLFIVSAQNDDEGNLISLTKNEEKYILDRVVNLCTYNYPEGYPMLTQVWY